MNTLTWTFFIALSISAFCAVMAALLYLVEELFLSIWGVKSNEADGLFWKFLKKGSKVLLSIAVWVLLLVGFCGILILILLMLYNVLSGAAFQ